MNMRNIVVAGLLTVAVLPGVASAAQTETVKQDAATIQLPAPPPGKGQIVFFRKGGLGGSAVACTVHEAGKKVSSLGGGRYFIVVAEPGRHEYSVKTEATDKLALEVEADETQFAACKIKMCIMVGRPDIRPATEADFRAAKSLRLVDADDMGEGPLRPDQVQTALSAPATESGQASAAK